jgi:uncharacterized repeat protein (TIGR03803 family)
MRSARLARGCLVAGFLLNSSFTVVPAWGAVSLLTLAEFGGTNGANPNSSLTLGTNGDFYGTCPAGGANGSGTIFKITTNGTLSTLASFNDTNGAASYASLIQGTDGIFYGTTSGGGSNGLGTVFRMTAGGTITSLVSFNNTNGAGCRSRLVQAIDGSFYGTTAIGGTNGDGAAFRIASNGSFTNLYSFDTNGFTPYGGLVQAKDGRLYGTTYQGGTNGNGIVFRLTTNGAFTPLHLLNGVSDGANPYAGLVPGPDGSLFGTAFYGGAYNFGTVYKITTNGALTPLVSFNGTNGAYPQGELLLANDGNFYGTTQNGGAYTNQFGTGYGTVFMLTAGGALTTLLSFNGTNGAFPRAGLVQTPDGSFYGTTSRGGASDNGTIFRLVVASQQPPVFQLVSQTGNMLTLTWSAIVGRSYQLQRKTDLDQPAWIDWGSPVIATNATMTSSDVLGPVAHQFYRIALLP